MYYLREIYLEEWQKNNNNELKEITGDAVTDLSTDENTLSLFLVDDEKQIMDACVFICNCKSNKDPVCFMYFDKETFEKKYRVDSSPIENTILDFGKYHCDIVNVNYDIIGKLALDIQDFIKKNANFIEYEIKEVGEYFVRKLSEDPSIKERIKPEKNIYNMLKKKNLL